MFPDKNDKRTVSEKILDSLNHREYLERIKNLLRDKYNLDVYQYRTPYFLRRISMMSKRQGTNDLKDIYNHINDSFEGYIDFLNTLTIHVTEFFRDRSMWNYLRDNVFSKIYHSDYIKIPTRAHPFRIWSAGCSSGQEPYSMAIMFVEAYKKQLRKDHKFAHFSRADIESLPFEIVAVDVNKRIIKKAQEGLYDAKSLKNSDPDLTKNYFDKVDDKYQICDEIKQKVKFSKLDLFTGKFPKRIDLIMCRNVVIYFTKEQQAILFKRFWESMNKGAHMIIGKSELLPPVVNKYFKLLKIAEHVYHRVEPENFGESPFSSYSHF
ncbi:MAG: CheR family methyltransferase [Promethearchaeota archaeon]